MQEVHLLHCGRKTEAGDATAAGGERAVFLAAVRKISKNSCRGVLDRVALSFAMPGKRSADKETLSFYVPRTLGRRLRKMAKMLGATVTDIVVMILAKETNRIELTAEDYEQIAADTRAAERQNPARPKAKVENKSQA